MAEVAMEGVYKRFGVTQALTGMSLTVGDGEFVVLLGPTGAGKTTALRVIAGLEQPDAGEVRIGGRDATRATPAERNLAFVFQQYSLYPHLSVFDNLAFPLRSPARRRPEPEIAATVRAVAETLRISDKLEQRVTRLSGGQMQRVALGRALVRRPSIYLMDEPLSSLDAKLRADLRIELKRIQVELGATTLYVTHDQTEAMTLASRIGVIDRGRLVQLGAPREIYEDPVNEYVASRLGSPAINLLPRALFPGTAMPTATVRLGIRTEHAAITRGTGGSEGEVTWVEHLGDQDHLHIRLGGHDCVTLSDPADGFAPGDKVTVTPTAPLFFDATGERVRA